MQCSPIPSADNQWLTKQLQLICIIMFLGVTSICPFVTSVSVLCPEPNALVKALRKLPILHDEQYAQQTRLYEYYDPPDNTLVLP